MKLPIPHNETQRLEALKKYQILDTLPEKQYDDIVELASFICDTPIALISLVDKDRQWFKARIGLEASETPRNISFCQYAILEKQVLEVSDATVDDKFKSNPLVTGNPNIVFYAGAPLTDPDGFNLGTLCVIDKQRKTLTEKQVSALKTLANHVVSTIVMRKKAEELIRTKNELENFFQLSLDYMCIANVTGYFEKVSPEFSINLGYSEEELLSTPFISFVHPDDVETTKMEIEKLGNGALTIQFINRFCAKNGESRWLSWNATPDLKTGRLYASARDISKDLEIQKELEDAKIKAEKLAHIKQDFLANMSHEIRTPMNAILGFSRLLLQTELNTTQSDYVNTIFQSSEHLLYIINDILDFSKIESGKLVLEETEFSLNEVVKNVSNVFTHTASQKGLRFLVDIDKSIDSNFIGDPYRITQVLINLINNAVKFTEKGFVELKISRIDSNEHNVTLKFLVKDTGIGISTKNQHKIFESFLQEHSNVTRKYGGTGLGLSIVKKLLELMGSKINIESEPNMGSTFSFDLVMPHVQKTTEKINEEKPLLLDNTNYKNLKILIVEDNEINYKLFNIIISKLECEIIWAKNGLEAVEITNKENFDIIFMDIQMPVMDGMEATKMIKKRNSDAFIVAMTAHAMKEEKDACIAVGMDDFVSKPITLSAIESILNKGVAKKTLQEDKLQVNFDLNFLEKEIGDDVMLKKEITLLFKKGIEEFCELSLKNIEEHNINGIYHSAHKLKTSLQMFGLNDLFLLIQEIETLAKVKDVDAVLFNKVKQFISYKDEIFTSLESLNQ